MMPSLASVQKHHCKLRIRVFRIGAGEELKDSFVVQCLVAWDAVCRPKDEGGLGIRSLADQNQCLLIKLLHRLHIVDDNPWARWVWRAGFGGSQATARPQLSLQETCLVATGRPCVTLSPCTAPSPRSGSATVASVGSCWTSGCPWGPCTSPCPHSSPTQLTCTSLSRTCSALACPPCLSPSSPRSLRPSGNAWLPSSTASVSTTPLTCRCSRGAGAPVGSVACKLRSPPSPGAATPLGVSSSSGGCSPSAGFRLGTPSSGRHPRARRRWLPRVPGCARDSEPPHVWLPFRSSLLVLYRGVFRPERHSRGLARPCGPGTVLADVPDPVLLAHLEASQWRCLQRDDPSLPRVKLRCRDDAVFWRARLPPRPRRTRMRGFGVCRGSSCLLPVVHLGAISLCTKKINAASSKAF
jgi:hypothetical protein